MKKQIIEIPKVGIFSLDSNTMSINIEKLYMNLNSDDVKILLNKIFDKTKKRLHIKINNDNSEVKKAFELNGFIKDNKIDNYVTYYLDYKQYVRFNNHLHINDNEILSVYNSNYKITDKKIKRKHYWDLPDGEYILKASIIIENHKNQFMVQILSDGAGEYSLPIGTVPYNEDSLTTILRELREEQGISLNKNELKYLFRMQANKKALMDVFYIKKDIPIKDMIIDNDEVLDVVYLTYDEIKSLYEQNFIIRESLYRALSKYKKEINDTTFSSEN